MATRKRRRPQYPTTSCPQPMRAKRTTNEEPWTVDEAGAADAGQDGRDAGAPRGAVGRRLVRRRNGDRDAERQGRDEGREDRSDAAGAGGGGDPGGSAGRRPCRCQGRSEEHTSE